MAARRKRPPLLSSLSVQLPSSEHEENIYEGISVRRKIFIRKESIPSSFASPKEDEEFILPETDHTEATTITKEPDNHLPSYTESIDSNHIPNDEISFVEHKDKVKVPLIKAIIENRLEDIVASIEVKEDLEVEDDSGFKPLHYACKSGNLEAVKLLINAGCDKVATNSDRVTSLHVAVRSGKDDVVGLLLEEGVTPDVREKKWGRTPIHEATLLANSRVLKVIINKLQEDPWESQKLLRISDKDGQTALHNASSRFMTEAISLLLSSGADVAATDNEGLTPMHVSLLSHRGKRRCGGVLSQLLEAGGDVEVVGGEDGERLSHFAARVGCSNCLDFLCQKGADLNAKNRKGRTPLHVTAAEGNDDATKYLMSKLVNFEALDNNGQRPLHLAILSDSPCTIETLITHGADPLARDSDGRTYIQLAILRRKMNAFQALVRIKSVQLPEELGEDLIHYCAALGFNISVNFLLDNGWDINLKDAKGRTALHRALNHGHEDLATMLINHNASLHEVDNAGATPLHYAVRWGGSDAILRLLVKKKAKLGVRDRLGRTPLHYAASKFSIMSDLYILLGGGSILDSQDHMGLTPLHLAARLGNESLVRILLENGAKHDIRDIYDFLPLDHAKEKNNKSIIKRLQSHEKRLQNKDNNDNEFQVDFEDKEIPKGNLTQHRKSLAW